VTRAAPGTWFLPWWSHLPPQEPPVTDPDPHVPTQDPEPDDSPVPPGAEAPPVELPGREGPAPRIRATAPAAKAAV
jgi:hypothetical protein